MDFEYYFENTPEFGLRMKILPNEKIAGDIFMIDGWLFSDVQSDGNYDLANFTNFLENSDMTNERFWGNSMIVDLVKDGNATIKWCFYEESPNSCTLPTQMLYEILQIWVAKNNELREERNKKEAEENK